MKRVIVLFLSALLFGWVVHAEQSIPPAEQHSQEKELILEYAEQLSFNEKQILNLKMVDNHTMKVYIDECSFCGSLRNPHARNEIARKTLNWFLNKTGSPKGTVEWYNSAQVKIMSISGTLSEAEITFGLPCAIK